MDSFFSRYVSLRYCTVIFFWFSRVPAAVHFELLVVVVVVVVVVIVVMVTCAHALPRFLI